MNMKIQLLKVLGDLLIYIWGHEQNSTYIHFNFLQSFQQKNYEKLSVIT